jgi:hypothetical protein
MNVPRFKPLLLLAALLGGACSSEYLQRYPPAIDYDQLELRMEALRRERDQLARQRLNQYYGALARTEWARARAEAEAMQRREEGLRIMERAQAVEEQRKEAARRESMRHMALVLRQ